MTFFEWEDRFSVGVAEMDDQHQRLISLINELHESAQPDRERNPRTAAARELVTIASVLDKMIAYAYHHLEDEEAYMVELGYPGYDKHKRDHKEFTDRIRSFKSDFDEGRAVVSAEIMQFLQDWWRSHILDADKEYGPFFNEKGLK